MTLRPTKDETIQKDLQYRLLNFNLLTQITNYASFIDEIDRKHKRV